MCVDSSGGGNEVRVKGQAEKENQSRVSMSASYVTSYQSLTDWADE